MDVLPDGRFLISTFGGVALYSPAGRLLASVEVRDSDSVVFFVPVPPLGLLLLAGLARRVRRRQWQE